MAVKVDLIITKSLTGILFVISCALICESKPFYRWYDYDNFPEAKPIQDTAGSVTALGTVNPLRPYEPWVLDCILYSTDKREPGKRHPRCQIVDENNAKEYAKFLFHVDQWEQAYPERAAKWNTRFPDGKVQERRKYEELKALADTHLNLVANNPSTEIVPCTADCTSTASTTTFADDASIPMEPSSSEEELG